MVESVSSRNEPSWGDLLWTPGERRTVGRSGKIQDKKISLVAESQTEIRSIDEPILLCASTPFVRGWR